MNGSELMRSASLRIRRAYQGTDTSVMPIAAVSTPTPRPTVTAIARISGGNARIESITRISAPSLMPPIEPASSPIKPPTNAPTSATSVATSSEMRAP